MSDFRSEIQRRADEIRALLAEARASSDDYFERVLVGDLESLARVATDHAITLDGVDEFLTEGSPRSS
jgi:hypothetical protein